jgi:hypothetical protein
VIVLKKCPLAGVVKLLGKNGQPPKLFYDNCCLEYQQIPAANIEKKRMAEL